MLIVCIFICIFSIQAIESGFAQGSTFQIFINNCSSPGQEACISNLIVLILLMILFSLVISFIIYSEYTT